MRMLEVREQRGSGVFGAEAPNRAARAVGHDTAVPNGAGPPPRQASARIGGLRRTRGGVPALRARIPHATAGDRGQGTGDSGTTAQLPRCALSSPLPHPSPLVGEGPGVGGTSPRRHSPLTETPPQESAQADFPQFQRRVSTRRAADFGLLSPRLDRSPGNPRAGAGGDVTLAPSHLRTFAHPFVEAP